MKVILDFGHGGIIDGIYQNRAGHAKSYKFPDGFEVLEGVTNRQIGRRLIRMLELGGISYHDLNSRDQEDMPLSQRIAKVNRLYAADKSCWLLSIHSNKMTKDASGESIAARGCETFVFDKASQKSLVIQGIAEEEFKKTHKFRGSKKMNLAMLRETNCPALLTESYFYTNRDDAEYLMSEEGQEAIAVTHYRIIERVRLL
jgi:N-acetylmuramoyl-L-alanine amidase